MKEFLIEGPVAAAEVRRAAALAGIARGALYEAKGKLGILSVKETDTPNGSWSWRLPEETAVSAEDSNILVRLVRSLSEGLRAQLAAVGADANDGEGDRSATFQPNVSLQGGRGPEDAREGDDGVRFVTCHAGLSPRELSGLGGAEIGDLAEDSKVLKGLMTALRQMVQGPRNGGQDAVGRAASATEGRPESEVLPDDSKVLSPA